MGSQSRERYQLGIFLRFSELESELGKGPKKIALRKLRKVRSWPSYVPDDKTSGEGFGDEPCDGIRIIPSKELDVCVASSEGVGQTTAEKANPGNRERSDTRRTASFFSSNASRQILTETGQSRREKRAVREKEYVSRRLSEFRQLAAVRKEQIHSASNPRHEAVRHKSRELQDALRSERQLEKRISSVMDTPVRYPSKEIRPPDALIAADSVRSYTGRKRPVATLPPGYLASRDGPITMGGPRNCMVRIGCVRQAGHKGICDTSMMCPKSSHRKARCRLLRGHLGDCDLVGWTCPDCGVPHGTRHLTPDCPTRLKRAKRATS